MPKIVMDRRAEDNKYLHRDFHLTVDNGLIYVGQNYGDDGIKELLTDYAKNVYRPLINDIKSKGLTALKEDLEAVYEAEEASDVLKAEITDGVLTVKVSKCPAVTYMLSQGHTPSKWYIETTRVVYDVIAKESGYKFNLISYDEKDGSQEWKVGK